MIKANGLESEAMKLHSLDAGRITGSLGNIDRIPRILYEFQKQFFGPKKWNILWVIFFTLFFFNLKRAFKGKILYITALLFLIMCAYGFAYLLIPLRPNEPINWIIGSALSRLFIHFTPLAVYWIAVICRERDYIRL